MKRCLQCFVSGKVQGVWFRASTKQQAEKLGLTGFARNLPDGRVEVIMAGDEEQILLLRTWLSVGPEKARVDEVVVNEIDYVEYSGFKTL